MSEAKVIQIAADVTGVDEPAGVKQIGFDAVALHGPVEASSIAARVQAWRDQGLEVCCIHTGATFGGGRADDLRRGEGVDRMIEQVSSAPVRRVVIDPPVVDRSTPVSTLIGSYGDWLARRADHAASLGVRVLVSNGGPFGHAADLWKLLDRLSHPAIGVCWDTLTSARQAEGASVVVSVLNSRIEIVRLRDGRATGTGSLVECPAGDGTVGVEQAVKRLRGIGFEGYVCVEPDAQVVARVNGWCVQHPVSDLETPFLKKVSADVKKVR